ncbi:hypothetical protein MASR2M78_10870 [Treponema sp.]
MEHFIIAVYVLLFMSGSGGLLSLFLLHLRLKSRLLHHFFIIQLLLLLGLSQVLIYFYLQNILINSNAALIQFLAISSTLTQALLYAVAFSMVYWLKQKKSLGKSLRTISLWLCSLVLITSFIGIVFSLIKEPFHNLLGSISPLLSLAGYILVGLTVFSIGLTLLIAPLSSEHSAVRLLSRGWAYCLLAFTPLTALEWALESYGPVPYSPLSLDFVFYLGCNLVSIIALFSSLKSKKANVEPAFLTNVSDDTAARFGLTLRERDMVPLIARGLANKEIAAELGISNATVRTHIYNLFQKVGAKSRIELLNRLDS